jgi:hypothetical protein
MCLCQQSQRNLKFPAIKQERRKASNEPPTKSTTKETNQRNKTTTEDETVKKLNNVEQSLKEKQIKTKNENIKGNVKSSEPEKSKVENKQKTTPGSNENLNQPESVSEQVLVRLSH